MKTKSKSPLWGMVCEIVEPGNQMLINQIANLDQRCSAKPWSLDAWRKQLRESNIVCAAVYGQDDRLIAFAVVRREQTKIRLLDILVAEEFRRIGVGRMLLEFIEIQQMDDVRSTLEIVVPERDLPTQIFLRKCGVKAIKVLRGEPSGHYLFRLNYIAPF